MKYLKLAIGVLFLFAISTQAKADGAPAASTTKTKTKSDTPQSLVKDTGHTDLAEVFKGKVDALVQAANGVAALDSSLINPGDMKTLTQATAFYKNLHGTCVKTQSTASWLCREKTSPQLQDSLNKINTVASMITGAAIQDACSNFAKVAQIAQMGLTAYTAACSAARAACEGACTTVYSNLKTLNDFNQSEGFIRIRCRDEVYVALQVEAESTSPTAPQAAAKVKACDALHERIADTQSYLTGTILPKDFVEADLESIALKNKACTYEYANMILSAGAGIASMINSFKQGQKCDEDTNGTGTEAVVADVTEKCADAANAQLPECICLANPRTPGCANSYQKANESGDSRLTASGAEINPAAINGKDGLAGLGLGSDSNSIGENSAGGSSDPGGIGAPMGGGGGLSGFGGAGGGSGGKEEAAKKGLNTDILSGSGGGGGGGFGGYRGAASDSKYRAYLPGGAKDPAQGVAGQQAWTKEVTGQGGKSNWEKVRERYRDNKNTLLNN